MGRNAPNAEFKNIRTIAIELKFISIQLKVFLKIIAIFVHCDQIILTLR